MAVKLATVSEIAIELGVRYQTVHMWIKRRHNSGFPEPVRVHELPAGGHHEVYDLNAVKKWHKHYTPKKGGAPKGNSNALVHGRYVGRKAAQARKKAEAEQRK